MLFQAPQLAIWPGLAIALSVLGLNLMGDGLRDLLRSAAVAATHRTVTSCVRRRRRGRGEK